MISHIQLLSFLFNFFQSHQVFFVKASNCLSSLHSKSHQDTGFRLTPKYIQSEAVPASHGIISNLAMNDPTNARAHTHARTHSAVWWAAFENWALLNMREGVFLCSRTHLAADTARHLTFLRLVTLPNLCGMRSCYLTEETLVQERCRLSKEMPRKWQRIYSPLTSKAHAVSAAFRGLRGGCVCKPRLSCPALPAARVPVMTTSLGREDGGHVWIRIVAFPVLSRGKGRDATNSARIGSNLQIGFHLLATLVPFWPWVPRLKEPVKMTLGPQNITRQWAEHGVLFSVDYRFLWKRN